MKNVKNLTLIGGGALGAAALTLGAAGVAGAQDAPTLDDPAPAEQTEETSERGERGRRGERRQAMVEQLLEDGVITQDQVDNVAEVREAIQAQREANKAEKLAAIAGAIDVTVEELEAAKDAGTPLADLAGDNLPALVDLFTERATDRIAQGVEDGRITQEQADEKLDGLEERIQTRIEDGGGLGRRGGEGKRGNGPRGQRGPAVEAPAEASFDA